MQRIYDATAAASLPSPPALTGTVGFFTEGSPGVTAATDVRGWWLNMVQEELISVLSAAGITPDTSATNFTQLLQALHTLGRIKLTTNINMYVSTTGSDSNTGLTSGTPFLTINRALIVLFEAYDLSGFGATINVAAGTYGAVNIPGPFVGANGPAAVTILGNNSSPGSVIIDGAGSNAVNCTLGGEVSISGVQFQSTSGTIPNGVGVTNGVISLANFACGVVGTSGAHITSGSPFGLILITTGYSITGSASAHILASQGGLISYGGTSNVCTLSGTPAFTEFAAAITGGIITISTAAIAFSGAATGQRYNASVGGIINTNSAGVNFFPGNVAGSSTTGYYT